jgi:flagellar motor switch protein FliN/FliY
MANDPDDKKKGADGLDLTELGDTAVKKDDRPESWDDPPSDIPDKPRSAQDLEAVYDIPVRVSAVLGKSSMQVHDLLKLGRGAVVELDRKVGEAIDIYVNDRLVARGEVVVVDDRLGITMTEIIKTQNK